jgi:hypothetical protein
MLSRNIVRRNDSIITVSQMTLSIMFSRIILWRNAALVCLAE